MRCDQYVGLNRWATELVSGTRKVRERGVRIYPDGTRQRFYRHVRIPLASPKVVGEIAGAWRDHVANLHRYTMPDGKVYEEFIQAVPWSGGPCYFIALKDENGEPVPDSLWSEDDIDNA